ncbi:Fatty acid desaturase [Gemmobacter aquatilis]|uniref:Fatty acid desaturase n=1 Tax=Gemmobacter aquatilis TaxID=933059 RepID=A0A1H8HXF6_9RHOB|nr:fatty acid desaturase [Gemmobacter aquatilis]SEN60665.1 Fatty acid desaturase [Gemmobacter aquatilis]
MRRPLPAIEWITLCLLIATYGIWALGTTAALHVSPVLGIILTALAIVQFSSLQHEALHGHPFRKAWLNEAAVFPALCLTVPYRRFRDTHLAHHHDPILTDPYDDPESNYMDPAVWARQPRWFQRLLMANNTLLGRMVIGPILGNVLWLKTEAGLIAQGNRAVIRDWLLHGVGLALVIGWLWWAPMSGGEYLAASYLAHAVLKIRTYLEHRAHLAPRARTAIVEDRGPLALLFLHNNLHVVHHAHPKVPWYDLPALYRAHRAEFQRRNDHYVYRSYAEIFRRHLLRAKDPVPHPVWPVKRR